MSQRRSGPFASGALVAIPAALLATAALMRAARGPSWLAFNFDPTYAYLLNSLIMLKGYRPFLIHHPGVPLQALGSVVMAGVHAASGSGPLAADVIARPEQFILWIHWAALLTAAALVTWSGVIVRRRAGVAAALLVQSGPWLSMTAASLLGHLRAEVLIAGTATLWTAWLVAHAIRPETSTPARLGTATGVTLALHTSALPLLLGPLVLAERWADRRRFAIWTGAAFLAAFAPAWLKLPSFAKLMLNIGMHSGSYGEGRPTIVDAAAYSAALPRLIAAEPVASAIVVLGAAVWIAWTFDGRTAEDAGARRGLGALVATQIAGVLLTAKHPDPHYLVPIYCSLGGSLCLSWRWLRARWPASAVAVAAVALAAIVFVQAVAFRHEVRRLTSARVEQESAARMAATEIDRGNCVAVWAYRSSSQAEALQWGNITAQFKGRPLLGREIAQRFPRALFDLGGLELRDSDWQPVDLRTVLGREPCVIYTGERARAPVAAAGAARVEWIRTSGAEGIYRLRPPQ